jgi:hypothetical protein
MGNGGVAPQFFTSVTDGSSGQLHILGRFTPMYPLDSTLGGPHSRSGRCGEKSLAPAGKGIPAVQPVTRRYTDWTLRACTESSMCRPIRRPGSLSIRRFGTDCGNPRQTEVHSFGNHPISESLLRHEVL